MCSTNILKAAPHLMSWLVMLNIYIDVNSTMITGKFIVTKKAPSQLLWLLEFLAFIFSISQKFDKTEIILCGREESEVLESSSPMEKCKCL
jgi:hypothetical protein